MCHQCHFMEKTSQTRFYSLAEFCSPQKGTLSGLMIKASHKTFSGQKRHMSGQIIFGQTNLLHIINGNFIEFVEIINAQTNFA